MRKFLIGLATGVVGAVAVSWGLCSYLSYLERNNNATFDTAQNTGNDGPQISVETSVAAEEVGF